MKYLLEYGNQHIYLLIFAILIIIIALKKDKSALAFVTMVSTFLLLLTPFFFPLFKYDNRYVCEYQYKYSGSEDYVVKASYYFWTDTNDYVKNNETYEKSKKVIDSVFNSIDSKTKSDDQFKTTINNIEDYEDIPLRVKGHDGRNMRLRIYIINIEKATL